MDIYVIISVAGRFGMAEKRGFYLPLNYQDKFS